MSFSYLERTVYLSSLRKGPLSATIPNGLLGRHMGSAPTGQRFFGITLLSGLLCAVTTTKYRKKVISFLKSTFCPSKIDLIAVVGSLRWLPSSVHMWKFKAFWKCLAYVGTVLEKMEGILEMPSING